MHEARQIPVPHTLTPSVLLQLDAQHMRNPLNQRQQLSRLSGSRQLDREVQLQPRLIAVKPLLGLKIEHLDAGSARVVEGAGFPAVATASAAVTAVLGYEDGGSAPAEEMFSAAARIARSVVVPVSMDAEDGYGLSAADLVDRLLTAGVVGCNLEDSDHAAGGLKDADAHASWLAEVRAAADARGVRVVVNARVDTFLSENMEVAAGVRQQLQADARRLGGLRLLDGHFMLIRQAMGVPKRRGERASAYLGAFVEAMKKSGFVAEALARHGIQGAAVAPLEAASDA